MVHLLDNIGADSVKFAPEELGELNKAVSAEDTKETEALPGSS